jgi:PIN domain nuclease of toxin-antitoxin system
MFLLDTHTLIWFLEGDSSLNIAARQTIIDPEEMIFFSMASLWEISIKRSIGKLALSQPTNQIIKQAEIEGIILLPIEANHILSTETLPFYHRDPFDRLIISQALTENLTIIGRDTVFDNYGVKRFW